MRIKCMNKERLNKIKYSVRVEQAVVQYGVGAMIDFPDQTLVTADTEKWSSPDFIVDDRLAKALNVTQFGTPKFVAYARFPKWYFCPKCREFRPIGEWEQIARRKKCDDSFCMVESLRCPKDGVPLTVTRFVSVCEDGHLDDFPWVEWVHARSKRSICSNPSLKIKSASHSEAADGVSVECSCGAWANLKGIFNRDVFKNLEEESGIKFRCTGYHPHKQVKEDCDRYPIVTLKGASSVYFPLVYSSLVIPYNIDSLEKRIRESSTYIRFLQSLDDEDSTKEKSSLLNIKFAKWATKVANDIGVSVEKIEKLLRRLFEEYINKTNEKNTTNPSSAEYRIKEYEALKGIIPNFDKSNKDFSREEMNIADYEVPFLKSLVLVDKVKVIKALVGFSRVNPTSDIGDAGFVDIRNKEHKWYPGFEVRGEGIFMEFDDEKIQQWISEHPQVVDRACILKENSRKSLIGMRSFDDITPKMIMLHTLAHTLINQLSYECGYSIASLSERIYCSDKEETKMSGIFIYTANGDSEGTLGGLVRQGRPDIFNILFKQAIEKIRICSNDPVCLNSLGQGYDSLNLAACHSCVLLPETCCEKHNSFLDRAMLIGTYDDSSIGFFDCI